jgi:transposase
MMNRVSKRVSKKDQIIEALRKELKEAREQIVILMNRIAELERRLGLNSDTSSKPPSSDGLGKEQKRPPISSKESSKPHGGQRGHKGKTMEQVSDPDVVVEHPVHVCSGCGADLSFVVAEKVIKRQVKDVEIKTVVVEHRGEVKVCQCGARTCGPFPAEVKAPMQAGNNVKTIALYLSGQFIAKARLSEAMEGIFSMPISDTTLLKHEHQLAQNLRAFHKDAYEYLQPVRLKHADETGVRIGGKTCWMHVLSTGHVTYLWPSASRKCTLTNLTGTVVHDHYSSYLSLPNITHAYCNAHHLRELKALIQYDKEEWAGTMHALLLCACCSKNNWSLSEHRISKFDAVYDTIVDQALAYHESLAPLRRVGKRGRDKKRIGHNLALRLQREKEGVLRFMKEPHVPFTNNQAEQDLRMVKVKQKVSGCFRTPAGAENFAIIRSFIGTLKKNGLDVLTALRTAVSRQMTLSEVAPRITVALLPAPS